MGGIRMKARGSSVDLIIADENPRNDEPSLEIESRTCPSLVGNGMNNQLCLPFSCPWINDVQSGLIPVDINDGIPCLPKPSAVAKVSEVRSILGRAGSAGLVKAVEVLDSLGSSMTNLSISSGGFSSGETGRKREISILAFEVAKTIVKGVKLIRSLSEGNIKHLKEVVLQSEGVRSLISSDMEGLLRIVATDKREELKSFSSEIVRFGGLCKDTQWHNLDRYFEKLHSKCPRQRHLKVEIESMMEQLMNLVQHTAELFYPLCALDKLEQDYRQKLQGVDSLNVAQKEIAILGRTLKNQRKHVSSLKKKSLWSKVLEEVIKKLVDIVHFLHFEIHEAFGNADGEESVESYWSNHKMLGPAGIALQYANIIRKIDAFVSRSSPVHPNMRDSLYQLLPHDIQSALRVKLQSFQFDKELAPAIKGQMDETLSWLVPVARNTTKTLHSFGWVGEWTIGGLPNQKPAGRIDVLRIETLHYADKQKTEAYILKLVLWLHHLIGQVKIGDGRMGPTVESSDHSHSRKTGRLYTPNPNDPSPMLTDKDQEMLQGVEKMKFVHGRSKSQKIGTSKTSLSRYDRLSQSSRNISTSKSMEDPFAAGWLSCAPVIDFDIDKNRALNLIDGLEKF